MKKTPKADTLAIVAAEFREAEHKAGGSIWKDPKEPFADWFYRKMGVEKPAKNG